MRANWQGNGKGTAASASAQKDDGHDKRHPGENLELSLHLYQISMSLVSFPCPLNQIRLGLAPGRSHFA